MYNAIANDGTMVEPYLVDAVTDNGTVVKQMEPKIVKEAICQPATLGKIRACLNGVCQDPEGTGYTLLKDLPFKVAGKTGTALVANGKRGYGDKVYQASFAGYFPANDPQYTCVVVIINKPHAAKFYGASVAGPVFKEIAQRLYTLYVKQDDSANIAKQNLQVSKDTTHYKYIGNSNDFGRFFNMMGVQYNYKPNNSVGDIVGVYNDNNKVAVSNDVVTTGKNMPDLKGMTLKDALYICENMGLKVAVVGRGRVEGQSIAMNSIVARGEVVKLNLN